MNTVVKVKQFCTALLVLSGTSGAWAQSIVCQGVLGNSGEAGKDLVRFSPREYSGLGVVVDRFGSLWDRAGEGTLNRYAPDGRLLAQYKIPKGVAGANGQDKIALVGDTVLLKLGDGLYTLPVDAPEGAAPKNLNLKATRLSSGVRDGWLAASNETEAFLFQPTTGQKKPLATLPAVPGTIEWGADGAVYTLTRGSINKVSDAAGVTLIGIDTPEWPKKFPGDRLQWLDGAWWGHTSHGTIYRYDDTFEPAPGVVLGGASGSFIGHLDQNTELNNGRGLAMLRPGVFAVSGWGGVMHLLQWQPDATQFQIVRRIGSVPFSRGIGLDKAGNVWWRSGSWRWGDRPDAPLDHGINTPEDGMVSQVVMLPGDMMVAVGRYTGKAMLYKGRLTTELDGDALKVSWGNKYVPVAAISYLGARNERMLMMLSATGEGKRLSITNEGGFRSDAGEVLVQTATPVKDWTSLANKDDKTLLGAADGQIIELARDGDNWKETSRWNSWGDGQKFGTSIWITADAGRLWVSDRDNNRVLCFDPTSKQLLATFGSDKGDDLKHLSAPESMMARGDRAVVFDSGNQRLVKLQFQK